MISFHSSDVNLLMLPKIALVAERLLAHAATVGLLARVRPLMQLQRARLAERLLAQATIVGLLARVYPRV